MRFYLHEYDAQSAQQQQQQTQVAILTMHDDQRPFRGNHFNFIDLINAGRDLGANVYVVTARDLKLNQRKINSYVYNAETKSWAQQLLPLPSVVYNRIPSRKDEQLPEVQSVIQACLKHANIRLFNPSFFNKWTLFEWLNKAKTTKKYIPVTKRLSSAEDLKAMVTQFEALYLKPVRGKAGKGIMKVETGNEIKGRKQYRLTIQSKKKSQVSLHPGLNRLWSKLKLQMGTEEYIAQQAIKLAYYNDRPFDLRVLVQKNQSGEWSLTGIGARVAGRMSITTHVPRGGTIDEPEKLLATFFGPDNGGRIFLRVKQAAFSIARQIEKASGHILGEMSMDLGIDTQGQIWFFEANSRPMKFDEPDIRKRSLERIIQYSQYLTKTRAKK